ncbi:MAG: type II secretion system F family protein [Nanoarchaeota archaeon]|nr:type II secretion system F family protein [Nanoarchaeota archaeon]
MDIKKIHWIGIGAGLIVVIASLFFMEEKWFFLVFGIGVVIGVIPFVFTLVNESKIASEKEEMFLEFARNLVESVKTGTPISKSIINLKGKPYGSLSSHINKLANQISLGIPLSTALQIFSRDVDNPTVSRALTLIGQAEKAGGEIGEILEAVAGAVSMTDKLKKERKATISTLVVQGYIIFFIFMIIVLVMQFKILPMLSGIAAPGGGIGVAGIGGEGGGVDSAALSNSFLYLLLIQGFFSGLAIGELADGNLKAGVKHSFALMLSAFLVSATANLFL